MTAAREIGIQWRKIAEAIGMAQSNASRKYGPARTRRQAHRSYEDFVAEQVEYAGSAAYERDVAFWRARADEIPSSIPPTSAHTDVTGIETVRTVPIAPDDWREVLRFARHAAATPFTVILTCLGRALRHLVGQSRIAIGLSVSMRPPEGYEAVVGNFTNIVPVVLDLRSGPLLRQVGHTTDAVLDSFDHARVPIQDILPAQTGQNRRDRAQPLTVTATTYAQHDRLTLPRGGTAHTVPVHRGASKVGLSVYLAVGADSAEIHVVSGASRRGDRQRTGG